LFAIKEDEMVKCRRGIIFGIAFILIVSVSGLLVAQDEKSWEDATSGIVGEILIKGSAYEKLHDLCDVIGPRVTGTPEFHKAADWALAQMQQIGLQNVRKEMWPIKDGVWRRGRSEAYLLEPFMHKIQAASMGWNQPTPEGGIKAEVINIGGFTLAEAADASLWSHKILLFDPSRDPQPEQKPEEVDWFKLFEMQNKLFDKAAKAGAFAVLIPYDVKGNRPHVGYSDPSPLPVISVGMEDGHFLQRITRRGNIKVTMYLKFEDTWNKEEAQGCNVIGEIPGRELPDEIVVVAGHLDCWDTGYGVQDDGSGIVAVLETARAFTALGIQPRRTVRFICLGGEEQGYWGSKAYLEKYKDDIAKHVAMFNHDNGAGEPRGFVIGKNRTEVKKNMSTIVEKLANLGATELQLWNPDGTDAVSFDEAGIPVFDMKVGMKGYSEIHHQNTDTFEWMERDNLVIGIAFYAACVYSVAELPHRIGPIKPQKKEEETQ
jgi:carboxypeptidase Q